VPEGGEAALRLVLIGRAVEHAGFARQAGRFDGSLEDVFDLQDKIAISVAGVIEPDYKMTAFIVDRRAV
jgi:TolB-like protein